MWRAAQFLNETVCFRIIGHDACVLEHSYALSIGNAEICFGVTGMSGHRWPSMLALTLGNSSVAPIYRTLRKRIGKKEGVRLEKRCG